MTENDIIKLLETRHSSDVFVAQCKDGPTWGQKHLRLDAWAMKRSWVNFRTIGYEIKVARSDFLSDKKWKNYLPYCQEFYFVSPHDVIRKEEVPESAGLIHATKNGTKLYTRKPATFREIEDPVALYLYILMSRAKIMPPYSPEVYPGYEREKSYWENWIRERKLDHRFGRRVSNAIGKEVNKLKGENNRLKRELSRYVDIEKEQLLMFAGDT